MSKILKNKNVVITGCLKGIGLSTLEVFAENGANIFACVQNEDFEFETYIKKLSEQYSVFIIPVYFDLANYDSIKSGMKYIQSFNYPIHGLVNIAGMVHNGLLHMTTIEKMKEVFDINFFSHLYITQFISKLMMKSKSGSIVNISSISAIDGNHGQVAYSSSKAAIIGATKTLSIELGKYGIRVNAIAPGVIATDMTKELSEDKLNNLLNKTKLNRIGKAVEVANSLVYLISDKSSYLTGQIIRVDGGIG